MTGSSNFLGLPPEASDPERAAAVVIPVPYDGTSTWGKGADKGPAALIEASTQVELFDIPTRSEPWRRGVATLPPVDCEGLDPQRMAHRVEAAVGKVLRRKQLPIVLGGEHSVSIGAVRAVSRKYPRLSVLQLDAHGDTRESYEGSPYNHACVMARVREWCPIVQVGIRAIDASEWEAMDRGRVFFAHDIHAEETAKGLAGRTAWIDRAVELLTDQVYVTIDLDCFDPSLLPATGTPEPGGLDWHQVMAVLQRVCANAKVVAFDIVELCPRPGQHASEFAAAKLAYRFLAENWRER